MNQAKPYFALFASMLKTGLFTFGGGYAMLPILEREFSEKRNWISGEEFLDMTAIAESTPGPIAVNAATFIGYKVGGVSGAALATFAVSFPSFAIIYLISLFFDAFLALTWVSCAFRGIQVCVVYLILSTGIRMLRQNVRRLWEAGILAATLICSVAFSLFAVRFSSIFLILISGTAVLCVRLTRALIERESKQKGRKKG